MYNVTQDFLNYIKQNSRQFKATLTIRDITFIDDDIISIDLDENVNPDETFMLGSVGSTKLEVTLMNVPGTLILDGADVTAVISLYTGSTFEDVPMGVFWVDEIDKNKGITKLTCYDNMIKLEKAYFSDLTYPASINAVAQEICTKAGVELVAALPGTQINKMDGYTLREAIGFIASFLGGFARFNRDGKLEIVSYTDSGFAIGVDNYFPPLTMNEKPFAIGKLTCKAGDATLTSGSSGNEIQFENPIMTQAQLDSILSTLSTLSYMPCSLDWQGNQALQAGDKITIVDENNNTYSTLLMQNKLSYSGGMKASASAVGKTDNGQEFSSSGSMKNAVDRLVTEQANIKVLLADKADINYMEANYAHINNGVIDNASINVEKVNNLYGNYAHLNNGIIDNATIDVGKVNNLSINYAHITNGIIDNALVGTEQIANGSITDAKIVELTADKITAGTLSVERLVIVGTTQSIVYKVNEANGTAQLSLTTIDGGALSQRSITADRIVSKAITADEIASRTITSNEMKTGTITATEMKTGTITAESGIIGSLDASKITTGYLSADRIQGGTLSLGVTTGSGSLKVYCSNGTITASSTGLNLESTSTTWEGVKLHQATYTGSGGDVDVYSGLSAKALSIQAISSAVTTGIEMGVYYPSEGPEEFAPYIKAYNTDYPIYVDTSSLNILGDVNFNNHALISNNSGSDNIDHIWHDDSTNTWHFCSDVSYHHQGNSKLACAYVVGAYGTMMQSTDEWLRINPNTEHSSGAYFAGSIVRTDGELQVGSSGQYFKANSSGVTIGGSLTVNSSHQLAVPTSTYPKIYGDGTSLTLSHTNNSTTYGVIIKADSFYARSDNQLNLGNSSNRWKQLYATTTTISTSDRNLKTDIQLLDEQKATDFIMALKPSSFKLIDGDSGRTHDGFISQEVEEALTSLGMTSMDFAGFIKSPKEKTNADGTTSIIEGEYIYGLRYSEFIAPMVKVIQELKKKIDILEQQLRA